MFGDQRCPPKVARVRELELEFSWSGADEDGFFNLRPELSCLSLEGTYEDSKQ